MLLPRLNTEHNFFFLKFILILSSTDLCKSRSMHACCTMCRCEIASETEVLRMFHATQGQRYCVNVHIDHQQKFHTSYQVLLPQQFLKKHDNARYCDKEKISQPEAEKYAVFMMTKINAFTGSVRLCQISLLHNFRSRLRRADLNQFF